VEVKDDRAPQSCGWGSCFQITEVMNRNMNRVEVQNVRLSVVKKTLWNLELEGTVTFTKPSVTGTPPPSISSTI
jgi:hypothetical protein